VRLHYPIKRTISSTDMSLRVASAPHMQEFGAACLNEHPWLPYTTSGPSPLVDLPAMMDLPTARHSSPYDSLYASLRPGFVAGCQVLATAGGIANVAAHRYALQQGSAGYGTREEAAASSDLSDLIVRESLVLPDILR
jgi:hypothetical protein